MTKTNSQPSKSPEKPSQKASQRTAHELENTLMNYILLFISGAFIGWVWEVVLSFFQYNTFVNRGVLHGPWLPIYGFGALGIVLLLNRFKKKPWLVFLSSAALCGLLEYFTGWYLETFKQMKWWDYSADMFNLDGRICALSVTSFGLAGLIVIYVFYPKLESFFDKLALKPKKILCLLLILCFSADFIYSSDNPNTGHGITSNIEETAETKQKL